MIARMHALRTLIDVRHGTLQSPDEMSEVDGSGGPWFPELLSIVEVEVQDMCIHKQTRMHALASTILQSSAHVSHCGASLIK